MSCLERLSAAGCAVELLVYDTSGQDVYMDQWTKSYAGRIAAVVLVFDVNDSSSFRCAPWYSTSLFSSRPHLFTLTAFPAHSSG